MHIVTPALPQRILTMALALAALHVCALLTGCRNDSDTSLPQDAVAQAYGNVLTLSQIRNSMPMSISADDSTRLARSLIKEWIETQLISEAAAYKLDMDQIDRMVQDYRNELIAMEYARLMYDTHAAEIPEDSLRAYYEANKEEFKLTRPMVKGVYIKAANDANSLAQMKRLYKSHKEADIDKLDKIATNRAVHYDYFRDKWVDWEQIESRVPYDFGPSATTFLRSNHTVDYSQGSFTYLLDITDVLYPGQIMPYEAARNTIRERLRFTDRQAYTTQLKKNLYNDALENGKITLFVDTK